MSFKKIQPEQLQMPTFFSDLGDIALNVTETGVGLNLSRGLTGEYSITGGLIINKRHVVRSADTGMNDFDPDNGGLVLNGAGNSVYDGNNVVINGTTNDVSGDWNISLNGNQQLFGANTNSCLGVGGMTFFDDATTGAVILKDQLGYSKTSYGNHALNIVFDGGTFLDGGDVVFETNLTATTAASGLFSGDFSVLGEMYLTGKKVATRHDVTGMLSGHFVEGGGYLSLSGSPDALELVYRSPMGSGQESKHR